MSADRPRGRIGRVRNARRRPRGLGLNLFAVPLGLAGLGGAWTAGATLLGAPTWPSELLFAVAGVIWVVFSVTYIVEGSVRYGAFRADLTHPGIGPFASYIPVVGIVLATHYGQYVPAAAPWIMGVLVAALGTVAAQLFAHWIVGDLHIDSLHPGYFLPVVAGAFIASIGLSSVGAHEAAVAAFGVGVFFWLVVGTVVTGRLMTRSQLPDAVKPTLAVLLAPPATGGIAWFAASGGVSGPIEFAFAGVVVMMLLVQIVLLPEYRKIAFSLAFWAFTFPAASAANFSVRWFAASPFAGWQAVAWVVLGVASAIILAIAARSIVFVVAARRARRSGLATMT
ncbi:SLAC1 family transporter [Subtercola endophyticus]|uniref:SLAC1 family transporter n=1 Tax=Subtercola endophyticus TaxID=2895559 RepID=UPI001E40A017|nr:TDT family transporter [Subtercola endophyticus]UFS58520.1 TDT family transporter [Subtercola endophyticus]